MGSLYLSDREMAAIKAIDSRELDQRLMQALDERHASILGSLSISAVHASIAHHLYRFGRDVEKHAQAKSAAKRKETWSAAWRSGDDLKHVVSTLKQRVEDQEAETQLVVIYDRITPPYQFQDRVEVAVHYRWRSTLEAPWSSGTITFFHDVDMRPDYSLAQPARKPSATKLETQRQETLFQRWRHLRMLALHAVREYLLTGGDGLAIPEQFEAKTGGNERFLNNHSCNFWEALGEPRDRPRSKIIALEQDATSAGIPSSTSEPATADGRFTLNARVTHRLFSVGMVVHIEGDKVTVDFGDRGTKRVVASFLNPVTDDEGGLE